MTFFIQKLIYKHTNLDLDFAVTHFCLGVQVSQRPSLSNSCDICTKPANRDYCKAWFLRALIIYRRLHRFWDQTLILKDRRITMSQKLQVIKKNLSTRKWKSSFVQFLISCCFFFPFFKRFFLKLK